MVNRDVIKSFEKCEELGRFRVLKLHVDPGLRELRLLIDELLNILADLLEATVIFGASSTNPEEDLQALKRLIAKDRNFVPTINDTVDVVSIELGN